MFQQIIFEEFILHQLWFSSSRGGLVCKGVSFSFSKFCTFCQRWIESRLGMLYRSCEFEIPIVLNVHILCCIYLINFSNLLVGWIVQPALLVLRHSDQLLVGSSYTDISYHDIWFRLFWTKVFSLFFTW